MVNLESLAEFLKTSENLEVKITESGLIITEKELNEKNIIPSDLSSFVSVYEQTEIVAAGGGYNITVERMSAHNFMKLLASVFSAEYNFEVTGEYTITASKKGANESIDESAKDTEMTMEELAEAIDADGVEVEIHEDGLKVVCSELMAMAEKIDSMSPNYDIQLTDDYITVTHGA